MLRIHDRRVEWREAPEGRVPPLHVVEDGGGAHVVRVGELRFRRTGRAQLRFVEHADGFDPARQVPPELGQRARVGKATGHPDNGDLVAAEVSRFSHARSRKIRSWDAAYVAPPSRVAAPPGRGHSAPLRRPPRHRGSQQGPGWSESGRGP